MRVILKEIQTIIRKIVNNDCIKRINKQYRDLFEWEEEVYCLLYIPNNILFNYRNLSRKHDRSCIFKPMSNEPNKAICVLSKNYK